MWFREELEAFKAKGATEADLKEPGVASLILKTVLEKHVDEIRRDPEFRKAVFRMVFEKASPELMRKWAKKDREAGNREIAYHFELIADQRERGEWVDSELN